MKHKIYKGGKDNYPLWWYGQSNRLQNFGDRTNFLVPNGPIFKGNGYYFDGVDDYMEDIYGRHLIRERTKGFWSQLYLTNSTVPPCGSAVGTGTWLEFCHNQSPKITGTIVFYPEFCPNLKTFYCYYNSISVIDISRITTFTAISCHHNNMSELDILNLIKVTNLDCANNQMDQSAVDKVLIDADAWGTSPTDGSIDISSNAIPSQAGEDAKTNLVNRGWTVTTDTA